jgi:hypothetical protein
MDDKYKDCEQRPQPHYDFEIAKICEWLKKHKLTMHVTLKGEVTFKKKLPSKCFQKSAAQCKPSIWL